MKQALLFIGTLFIITVFAWNIYCVQVLLAQQNYNSGLEEGYRLGIQQCVRPSFGDSAHKGDTKA